MPEQKITEAYIEWDANTEGDLWGEFFASVYNRNSKGGGIVPPETRTLALNCWGQLEYISLAVGRFDAMQRLQEQRKFVRAFTQAFNHTSELKS